MSFWAYLYQLRVSFIKFLNIKHAVTTHQKRTKYALEASAETEYCLNQKCKKAALEVQYVSSFTHWPIAKPKLKTHKNSLVYLDVNRSKRAPLEQRNKRASHTNAETKKSNLPNKITSVKKIPNN